MIQLLKLYLIFFNFNFFRNGIEEKTKIGREVIAPLSIINVITFFKKNPFRYKIHQGSIPYIQLRFHMQYQERIPARIGGRRKFYRYGYRLRFE